MLYSRWLTYKGVSTMKMINKLIVPVTASALLLGACGASATDSKENTLISSKAGDVTVADTMKKSVKIKLQMHHLLKC